MRIHIYSNNTLYMHDYNTIDEVNEFDYENVIYINCHNHKLSNVDFINKFPNLQRLIASNNYLTHIPDHNNIEILDINTNKIIRLGYYPKLIKLYAFNNLIKHYSIPITVIELDISNNKLTRLNVNKKQLFSLFNIKYNNLEKTLQNKICNYSYANLNTIYE